MQLFVGRLSLLVGGLKLLIHRFVLFRNRLKIFPGDGKLAPQPGGFSGGLPEVFRNMARQLGRGAFLPRQSLFARGFKNDQEKPVLEIAERGDFQMDPAGFVIMPKREVLQPGRVVLLPGFLNGGAHRQHQPLAQHFEEIVGRFPGGRFEEGTGHPAKLQNIQVFIYQDAGRRIFRQRHPVRFLVGIRFIGDA